MPLIATNWFYVKRNSLSDKWYQSPEVMKLSHRILIVREGLLRHNIAPCDHLKTGMLGTMARSIKDLSLPPLHQLILGRMIVHSPTNLT
jgi:hypothetical protein